MFEIDIETFDTLWPNLCGLYRAGWCDDLGSSQSVAVN